jgi:ankyrin repeat protein
VHNAAFEGWLEGVELLLKLGAKVRVRVRVCPLLPPSSSEEATLGLTEFLAIHSPKTTGMPAHIRTEHTCCSPQQVNASNNAGDTPWHWAQNMGHDGVMALLVKVGKAVRVSVHMRACAIACALHTVSPQRCRSID